jgi:predicted ABC-type transport system involved in lysophospholipase L1 biosynthesis ATPase subunit
MMRHATFRAENLTKVYDTGTEKVEALRGVTMALYAGEIAVLLGPSGSGKSTLLNILGRLDVATGGKVMFEDRDLTALGESELTAYRRSYVGSKGIMNHSSWQLIGTEPLSRIAVGSRSAVECNRPVCCLMQRCQFADPHKSGVGL